MLVPVAGTSSLKTVLNALAEAVGFFVLSCPAYIFVLSPGRIIANFFVSWSVDYNERQVRIIMPHDKHLPGSFEALLGYGLKDHHNDDP